MKRILCLILAFVLVLSLVACGSGNTKSKRKGSTSGSGEKKSDVEVQKPKEEENSNEETVEEQVILDENDIKITTTGLDKSGWFGAELKVQIENNSSKDLTFQVRNVPVNGYMVDSMFSSDVAAGKKSNDSITFSGSSLEVCGIKTIADMEFSFHIFDDDWDDYLDSDLIQIKTSAATSYTYKFDDSGDELYNGDGLRIVSKGIYEDNSIFGPSLVVYIENKSENSMTIQVRDVSVNGFMVDTVFSAEVSSGKCAIDGITVMSSSLEENNIDSIEEMEFSFHIFQTDDWSNDIDTSPIAVKAN